MLPMAHSPRAFLRGPRRGLDHVQVLCLEDRVERSAVCAVVVPQEKTQGLRAHPEADGEVPRLLHRPLSRRVGGDAVMCRRRAPCSPNAGAYGRLPSAVPGGKKSVAMMPSARAVGTSVQVGPVRRGAGAMPAVWRIPRPVGAAIGPVRPEPACAPIAGSPGQAAGSASRGRRGSVAVRCGRVGRVGRHSPPSRRSTCDAGPAGSRA